jgi:hypothetical protein
LDVIRTVGQILESAPEVVYGEQLFNQVVIEAWRRSAIGSLDIPREEFIKIVANHGWRYEESRHYWVRNGHRSQATTLWHDDVPMG